jgi:hypothetical protein
LKQRLRLVADLDAPGEVTRPKIPMTQALFLYLNVVEDHQGRRSQMVTMPRIDWQMVII